MKRVILALVLLAAVSAVARGQQAAGGDAAANERRQDLRRLLTLTRGAEVGAQFIRQSIDQLRNTLTFLPEEQREKVLKVFEEEMLKEFTSERMVELVAPIYEKHLTAEEVKGLIEFYETPLGRRMAEVLPVLSREAYEAGAARGREAAQRAMARVVREGVLSTTPPTLAPAPVIVEEPPKPARTTSRRRTPRKRRN